jgi:hypothetical protein
VALADPLIVPAVWRRPTRALAALAGGEALDIAEPSGLTDADHSPRDCDARFRDELLGFD